MQKMNAEMLRFLISGMVSTFVALISFPLIIKLDIFTGSFFFAYVLAWMINTIVSFLGQKYFVFKSPGSLVMELLKFSPISIIITVLGYFILKELIVATDDMIFLSNAAVVTLSSVTSFSSHKLITFRKGKNV